MSEQARARAAGQRKAEPAGPTAPTPAPLTPVAELVPRAAIRRFDVFAEFNRLRNEEKGQSPELAMGNALWLAKMVAGRKFATTPAKKSQYQEALRRGAAPSGPYHTLGGVPQTAPRFEREVIERMGPEFYARVFAPAIAAAFAAGETYETIRDTLRAPWNLRRTKRR